MYFIIEGKVNILSPNESQIVVSLGKGNYFGEIALFNPFAKRICSVQAGTFCRIYILYKKDLQEIFKDFPLLEEIFLNEG